MKKFYLPELLLECAVLFAALIVWLAMCVFLILDRVLSMLDVPPRRDTR